jgi:hypothetical protein
LCYIRRMIKRNRKLPQSRYYLQAANYGIEALVTREPMDEGFLFFTVGILASLRAVQHALIHHDIKLSAQHKAAIEAWVNSTPMNTFIKSSRDLILKKGAFKAYAGPRLGDVGERTYATGYYDKNGKHRDLIADMRAAVEWCDRELTALEAQVPAISLPGDAVE